MEDRINELKSKFPAMANFFTILPKLMGLQMALFRDTRVPRWLKLMTAGTVAYVALPFDFLPDFAPLVGKGDDIVVILLVLVQYMKFCPPDVLREHWLEHMGDDYDMEQTLRRAMDEIEPVVADRYATIKGTIEGVLARFGRATSPAPQPLPQSPDAPAAE
jgi:uncharacterized membrane protein YkvA (DUF1232 family)